MRLGVGNWLVQKIGGWLSKNKPPRRAYLCDFDRIRYEIRPGDVLLVEGRNHISHSIQQITQSPWSHAMLYIGRLHDIDDPELRKVVKEHYDGDRADQLVIESLLGKGTIITPLTQYHEDHIRISRPQGLSRNDAQKVIAYAISRLGCEYNLRHVFDLMRFLFPWAIMPRRWRSTLFEASASRPTHDICSSVIAAAFTSVKFPILPIVKHDSERGLELIARHAKLFTPSDFDYSPYFNIIKYPFFAIAEKMDYKDLPWREDKIAIEDRQDIKIVDRPNAGNDPETQEKEKKKKGE